jgi:hypothetical protein
MLRDVKMSPPGDDDLVETPPSAGTSDHHLAERHRPFHADIVRWAIFLYCTEPHTIKDSVVANQMTVPIL